MLATQASLDLKDIAIKGVQVLSGAINVGAQYQRIITENPGLDAARVLLYHVDVTYANGGYTDEQYGAVSRSIIDKILASISSGPQGRP